MIKNKLISETNKTLQQNLWENMCTFLKNKHTKKPKNKNQNPVDEAL